MNYSPSLNNGRSRYADDDYRSSSGSRHHGGGRRDGRRTSRSKSPELNSSRYLSHLSSAHNSSPSSYGAASKLMGAADYDRAQSLGAQLGAAQSQVLQLETELSNTKTAKIHAEHRLLTLQRDVNALQKRNTEVIDVMKTLEMGVEALQKEKLALVAERDELKAKLDASERNTAVLTEQVSYLNERNSTLSKKCVDLLDGSKECREKVIVYEEELKRIRPRYQEMDAQFGTLEEQNKTFSTRLNMFEMRERIWIREKAEMEQRQQETMDSWQKMSTELRAQHQMELQRLSTNTMVASGLATTDMDRLEQHIRDLHKLLDSVQRQHRTELDRYRRRIRQLEDDISSIGATAKEIYSRKIAVPKQHQHHQSQSSSSASSSTANKNSGKAATIAKNGDQRDGGKENTTSHTKKEEEGNGASSIIARSKCNNSASGEQQLIAREGKGEGPPKQNAAAAPTPVN